MSYVCSGCSYRTNKWVGFCPQCKERGSVREVATDGTSGSRLAPVAITCASDEVAARAPIGIGEVDHVLGGGLVPGGVVLLGGEPGVGKSTLLLQVAASRARHGADGDAVLVATGEESVGQVGMRAQRIGAAASGVAVAATRRLEDVVAAVAAGDHTLVIVDSIQTLAAADVDGAGGGVTQVRECTARLIAAAKDSGTSLILAGHVTKEGSLAGPKVVEHMVDVVVHLDGSDGSGLRLLRSLKNRYGSADRVGLFEMGDDGLREVTDPVGCLAAGWNGRSEGTVLYPSVQGKRPLLVEVQALVVPSRAHNPRRSCKGVEAARVHQVLAVLEKHAGMSFSDREVYVSMAGGAQSREPAADLPVALALASSRLGRPIGKVAAWGEVGLTGELRPVSRTDARREEALRLGATEIITPEDDDGTLLGALARIGVEAVRSVRHLTRHR